MDTAKLLDFFNFFDESPTKPGRHEHGATNKDEDRNGWKSASGTTSPMSSSACSPAPELHTPPPRTTPQAGPEARPSEVCPLEGVKKRRSVRKRRSSVFFRLSEMGKVRNSAALVADREKRNQLTSKVDDISSSSRCSTGGAALTPNNAAPSSSARPSKKDPEMELPVEDATAALIATVEAAVDVTARQADPSRQDFGVSMVGPEQRKAKHSRRSKAYGESRLGRRENVSSGALFPRGGRPSTRALSAGHRRESCRDGGFSRPCDHGLSAEKLLGDAQDVARIRSDGGLRASFQGVCWIASNCCVGDKKSLLSGRRYLVLCDKIVWAELCEAGGRDSVTSRASVEEDRGKQAGFQPVISMVGAIVQHCEVATSNNGWVIEVVNRETNTFLWLDPANPTGLLRWGSVLCQALEEDLGEEEDGQVDEDS